MKKSTIIIITFISYLTIGILFLVFSIIIWKSKELTIQKKEQPTELANDKELASFIKIYLAILGAIFLLTSIILIFVQSFLIIIISGIITFPCIIIGSIAVSKYFSNY